MNAFTKLVIKSSVFECETIRNTIYKLILYFQLKHAGKVNKNRGGINNTILVQSFKIKAFHAITLRKRHATALGNWRSKSP